MRGDDFSITEFACGRLHLIVCRGNAPSYFDMHRRDAEKVDEYGQSDDGARLWIGASTDPKRSAQLIVDQRFSPSVGGFNPGVLFAPEAGTLFIGAGERLLCYRFASDIQRLWVDETYCGFWAWHRHGDVVVMSAELELAAWSIDGTKLWSMYVEPPWSYEVRGERVSLDVMGAPTSFDLRAGPTQPR
jgi:hypothetical protein